MNVLDEWLRTVSQALGVDGGDLDRDLILNMTREVAHNVSRPAAPLTAFLVGLAAGRAGGGADEVSRAAAKASALANGYTAPDGE